MKACLSSVVFLFLMIQRPPRSTRTDTLFPYTTLFRSAFSTEDLDCDLCEVRRRRIDRLDPDPASDTSKFFEMGRKRSFGARSRRRQTDSATTANKGHTQQGGMLPGRFGGVLQSSPLKEVRTGRSEERRVGKECVSPCNS